MRIIYEAYDGKQFEDEDECLNYEYGFKHPNLFCIKFYNVNEEQIFLNKDNVFDDNIYFNCEKIEIPENAFLDFEDLYACCGWCEFEQIAAPGKWKRVVPEGQIDGKWIQVKES